MSREMTSYNRPNSVWDFMSEVEKAFGEIWDTPRATSAREPRMLSTFSPPVDVHETNEYFLLSLDLPGIPQSAIQIDVKEGRLSISGERAQTEKKDDGMFKRFERVTGKFQRSFQLPQNIDESKIQARMEHGVLEVMVPKAEAVKPRAIKIEAEKGGLFSRLLDNKKSESKEDGSH